MSIQPGIATSPGTLAGQTDRMADYNRRIAALEAARTVFRGPVITGSMIATGAIQAGHLSANSVTAGAIAAGSIIADHISSGAINAGHISAASIDTVHLVAGAVTANELAALSVQAGHITAGAVQATHISAGTIESQHIVAGAIITEKLAVDSVTAEKINVATLDAITTNMGSITAGTITGATVQSASTGSRVVQDSLGIRGYALDGITKTFEINTGTGIASFVGIATLDANSVVPTGTLSGFLSGGNLVSNSSFEQGVNPDTGADQWFEGWVEINATVAKNTANHMHGSQSAALTALGGDMYLQLTTAKRIRVRPGRRYYGSAYTKAATTTRPTYIFVTYYDAGGTQLSQSNSAGVTNSTTEFVRATYLTPAAPNGAAFADIIVYIGGPVAGEVHYVDGVQFEEGDTLTAYQPLATEILYSSIRSVFIGAGQVKANNIEAGAITAQKIKVAFGGSQMLQNAKFAYWPSGDSPWMWNPYERGGAGTRVWSKVASGGPHGENAWRLQLTNADTFHGFGSTPQHVIQPNVTYVQSWWWKGASPPEVASNTTWDAIYEWIENPTPSPTVWQRYSRRMRSTVGGALSGKDHLYVYCPAGTQDVQIALPQFEPGEFPSAHTPMADEVLPGSVGATQITPSSITADRMVAGTITAASGIIADAAITNAKIVSVDAGKITTGFLDAARIQANTITADKINVAFSGGNRLLNSNLNDGINGRMTNLTQWYGPYEASGGGVYADPGYPGGYALYAPTNAAAANPHVYTPMVNCSFWSKVSVGMFVYTPTGKTRRIGVEWFDSAQTLLAGTVILDEVASGWRREVRQNVTKPAGAYYVRFYAQVLNADVNSGIHWAAASIEEGEKATAWALAADDLVPGSVTSTKIGPGTIDTGHITADGITGKLFQSSAAHPKVAFDATGFYKTDTNGDKAINLGTGSGEGLQLFAKQGNGYLAANDVYTVNWRNSSGAIMASIWGTSAVSTDPNRGALWLTARNSVLNSQCDVMIAAYNYNATNGVANVTDIAVVGGTPAGTGRGIYVSAGVAGGAKWLLRGDEYSDWLRRDREGVLAGTLTVNSGTTATDRRLTIAGGLTYGIVVESSTWIGTHSVSTHPSGYDFYAAGAAINYGPFTGAHDVRLRGAPENFLPGMLVSSTGTVARRQKSDGELSLSSTLPQVELSTVANAKAVFGVFAGERRPDLPDQYYVPEQGERLGIVNALGEGRVLVCDMNGEINNGDYITPGPIPGIGVRQDDDILRSSTAAKATEPSMFASRPTSFTHEGRPVKTKLIACTYHCG